MVLTFARGWQVAVNPQPSTLNPQPSALNPQPSTLNPTPQQVAVDRIARLERDLSDHRADSSAVQRAFDEETEALNAAVRHIQALQREVPALPY
jgi:hypothetical protein